MGVLRNHTCLSDSLRLCEQQKSQWGAAYAFLANQKTNQSETVSACQLFQHLADVGFSMQVWMKLGKQLKSHTAFVQK